MKCKIPKKDKEDYRIVLQRAYFTYRCTAEDFERQNEEMLDNYDTLKRLIFSKAIVPEFTKDPIDMEKGEFEEFYKNLIIKCVHPRRGVLLPSEVLGTIINPKEEKSDVTDKTLKGAEEVKSVQMSGQAPESVSTEVKKEEDVRVPEVKSEVKPAAEPKEPQEIKKEPEAK